VSNQSFFVVQQTENDIFEHIKQGNQRVFEQVFRQHYASLCRYANGILKDEDEAEEIVQNMFVGVWEKRQDIGINQSIKSYLYRSVHNHCLNRIKHLKIRETHQEYVTFHESGAFEAVTETVYKNELEERIVSAVAKLPEQCRIIFSMSRFEELKYNEIAERMGLSVKTIENQIGKALKIMRKELAEFIPILIPFGLWILNQP
jgi:RNA polymerase sigma-70 factor (family 1)